MECLSVCRSMLNASSLTRSYGHSSNREQLQAEIDELGDEKNGLEDTEARVRTGNRTEIPRARAKERGVGGALKSSCSAPTETELTPPPVEVPDPDATKQQPDAEIEVSYLRKRTKLEQRN